MADTEYQHTFANGGWSTIHHGVWRKLFGRLSSRGEPVRILEIGCFEGQSACWYVDNVMDHPDSTLCCVDTWGGGEEFQRSKSLQHIDFAVVEQNFMTNIARSKYPEKVSVMKSDSHRALAQLYMQGYVFDYIYIDGSHRAFDVLLDAALAFKMLRVHGFLVFDDYNNQMSTSDETLRPRPGIDALVRTLGKHAVGSKTSQNQFFLKKLTSSFD
jgi:predicted O-methyltransferase YrrM